VLRFRETAAGNVVATGNTLGLSKTDGQNGPGTGDSIGTFLTLDEGSVDDFPQQLDNPWGTGTTNDWTLNGSEAELILPGDNTQVLHAELIWGGSTWYGTENVTGDVDSEVTLSFGDDSLLVAPDPASAEDYMLIADEGFAVNNYVRSADVTDFVSEHGAGFYAAEGIPATQDSAVNELNTAGWTLVVAYRTAGEQVRNLTIFVGGSYVDENATVDYEFSGFCTPPAGEFDGYAVVSAMEGDADREGDSFAIAQTDAGPFVNLSGPNNPENNFFCSQLNDADGMLDTAGTAGDANHDAIAGENVVGGRQGWDVTRVSVNSGDNQLFNGQTEAVIRTQTNSDSYIPTLVAFGIEVNAPDLSGASAGAEPTSLALEQTSTVTVDIDNVGEVHATGLVFQVELPDGLALDSFTTNGDDGDANGDAVDAAGLAAGVPVGDVDTNGAIQLQFVVRSESAPTGDNYVLTPSWTYEYVSCTGEAPLTEPQVLADIVIDFEGEDATTSGGTSDSDTATTGPDTDGDTSDSDSDSDGETSESDSNGETTDSDSDTDGASDSIGSGADDSDDGCGCTSGDDGAPAALALFGLVLGMRRRRRK
jgi:MYXO-CTERM domain-containing protein